MTYVSQYAAGESPSETANASQKRFMAGIPKVRPDRKGAGFRVARLLVRNIGILDTLDLDFDSQSVTALYAGNGLGKTTLLECLSILGHLPCFPTFNRETGHCRSLLETEFPYEGCDDFTHYRGVFDPQKARTFGTLSHLSEVAPGPGATFGYVEFEVEDRIGQTTSFNRFAVIVHSPLLQRPGTPRLTDILSRDSSLVRNLHGLPNSADDRILGRCGLIVYDPERQSGRSVDQLILAMAKGRTFSVNESAGGGACRLTVAGLEDVEPRSVSYVNTDLNDFGRGNDLRESPKDLDRDFREQMIGRIGIEVDKEGCFQHFNDLKRSCDIVLSTPLENFGDRRVIPPGFDLQNLTVTANHVGIWIDRLDGQRPVPINFLSAGENEVLFIYLMVLNFTRNAGKGASIILLDEPDLHISNVSRFRFFQEVLRLSDGRAQLIMSTHSPAAYEVMKATYRDVGAKTKVLVRVLDEDVGATKLEANFDGVYIGRLRQRNYSRGIGSKLWHFVDFTAARIRSVIPMPSYAASAATIAWLVTVVGVVLLLIGAVLNDVLNNDNVHWAWRRLLFFGIGPLRYHDETLRYWITFVPPALVAPISLLLLRIRVRRRHEKRLTRFRDAVRARRS